MNGVEILSSIEVAIEHAFNWRAFLFFSIIILGIFIATGVAIYKNENSEINTIFYCCLIGIVLGGIFGYMFGKELGIPTKYVTEYKVIISDEVSMNEFTERYEIINQEGKIFTVREREEQNDIP